MGKKIRNLEQHEELPRNVFIPLYIDPPIDFWYADQYLSEVDIDDEFDHFRADDEDEQ